LDLNIVVDVLDASCCAPILITSICHYEARFEAGFQRSVVICALCCLCADGAREKAEETATVPLRSELTYVESLRQVSEDNSLFFSVLFSVFSFSLCFSSAFCPSFYVFQPEKDSVIYEEGTICQCVR